MLRPQGNHIHLFSDEYEQVPFASFAAPASLNHIVNQLSYQGRKAGIRCRDELYSFCVGSGPVVPGDYIFESSMKCFVSCGDLRFAIHLTLTKNTVISMFPILNNSLKDIIPSHSGVSFDTHELRYKGHSIPSSAIIDEVLYDGCQLEIVHLPISRLRSSSRPSSPTPLSSPSSNPPTPLSTSGNIITMKALARKTLLTSAGAIFGAYGILPKDIWVLLISQYLSYGQLKKLTSLNGSISRLAKQTLETRCKRVRRVRFSPQEIFPIFHPVGEFHAFHFYSNGSLAVMEADVSSESPVFTLLKGSAETHLPPLLPFSSSSSSSSSPSSSSSSSQSQIVRLPSDVKGCSDLAISPQTNLLYCADDAASRIVLLSERAKVVKSITKSAGLHSPPGAIALDAKGEHIIIADTNKNRIQIWSRDGKLIRMFGKAGVEDGDLRLPSGVALTRENHIVVSDTYNHRIQIFTFEGKFIRKFGSRGAELGQFNFPWGIDVDADDRIWIADFRNGRVQVLEAAAASGRVQLSIGASLFTLPRSVKIREDGAVFVLEMKRLWILK